MSPDAWQELTELNDRLEAENQRLREEIALVAKVRDRRERELDSAEAVRDAAAARLEELAARWESGYASSWHVARVAQLEREVAQREAQLGFTEACAAHGVDYSESCGACTVAKRVAALAVPPAEPATKEEPCHGGPSSGSSPSSSGWSPSASNSSTPDVPSAPGPQTAAEALREALRSQGLPEGASLADLIRHERGNARAAGNAEGYASALSGRAAADTHTDALRDFAENGLRCDLNPTMPLNRIEDLYLAYVTYLERADANVRSRARAALAAAGGEEGE